jgi:hypothetical protein
MSDRLPRRRREQRAYRLTLATGASSVGTVVVFVLWVIGATSFGVFLLLALITAALVYGLRRTLGR